MRTSPASPNWCSAPKRFVDGVASPISLAWLLGNIGEQINGVRWVCAPRGNMIYANKHMRLIETEMWS